MSCEKGKIEHRFKRKMSRRHLRTWPLPCRGERVHKQTPHCLKEEPALQKGGSWAPVLLQPLLPTVCDLLLTPVIQPQQRNPALLQNFITRDIWTSPKCFLWRITRSSLGPHTLHPWESPLPSLLPGVGEGGGGFSVMFLGNPVS